MILLSRVERAWAKKVFSIIGTGGLLLMAAALVGAPLRGGCAHGRPLESLRVMRKATCGTS
jgi:hypothetical protein